MNPSSYRRDGTNQQMDSTLVSLLLVSLVFMQVVSATDQINSTATVGDTVILPCEDPHKGEIIVVEWSRTDLELEYVLRYRDNQLDPGAQHPSYKNRADLLVGQMKVGDASLILRNTTTDDSGTYECRQVQTGSDEKLISTVSLKVSPPPDPLPVWVKVLLVLLVLLVLVVAAGVSFYFWLLWKPVPEQVEVEPGVEFVLLPFKVPRFLWFCKYRRSVNKVEWKDKDNRTVLVYQNGSDQPGEQDQRYRTRTKMDENLLKTGDLSLTLRRPTDGDSDSYTCRVYSRKGNVLMEKRVWLKVKDQQVEVESGVASVELPWTIKEDLDGDVRVEWRDDRDRTVHVYQDGSDQPDEQNQIYRTRTKMDENLLKTKDLSLTLRRPTYGDSNIYICRVYRDGNVLMKKELQLKVEVQQVEVESGVEFVKLPWTIKEDLDGDVRVEWRDSRYRKVHVYQDGSDQTGEQNQIYRTRTKMDEKPLETKDLSLTLFWPTYKDRGKYTCSVYRDGNVLMKKDIQLRVKVQQLEVESGVESVKLPWTIKEDLDGDVRVEWKDNRYRMVHVYQNGSDQPGDQDQIYRTRTKMDENLLETKDLSLTLRRPTYEDSNIYTCRVYRDGNVLMENRVDLQVKAGTVQDQPKDTRTSRNFTDPTPLMADQSV